MYRDDYSRAGIRVLPVVEPDGESTARQIALASVLLVPVSLLPSYLGMTGTVYAVGAAGLGLGLLGVGARLAPSRRTLCARQVPMASGCLFAGAVC
jgi:protoheme IX farnesyltransferase